MKKNFGIKNFRKKNSEKFSEKKIGKKISEKKISEKNFGKISQKLKLSVKFFQRGLRVTDDCTKKEKGNYNKQTPTGYNAGIYYSCSFCSWSAHVISAHASRHF